MHMTFVVNCGPIADACAGVFKVDVDYLASKVTVIGMRPNVQDVLKKAKKVDKKAQIIVDPPPPPPAPPVEAPPPPAPEP